MHAHFCLVFLAMAPLAISSPVAEPDPAPVDPGVASVVASNLNLGCVNGCAGASSAQQLSANTALGSAVNPLSVVGAFALAGGVLAAL